MRAKSAALKRRRRVAAAMVTVGLLAFFIPAVRFFRSLTGAMAVSNAADLINRTKARGHRVICVGTTSCRTVESAAAEDGTVQAGADNTSIFIYPGYRFKVMDALITNFHLPESTLVMLVSAFAGREQVLHAYQTAVERRYRFFSFGDACYFY